MLETAKKEGYAYPAVNVTTIEVINGALRAFSEAKSDGIIQVSIGGGKFASGTSVGIVLAEATRRLAEEHKVLVGLHTDHCQPEHVDTFLRPLLAESRRRVERGEAPLFNSHMLDASTLPMAENLKLSQELLKECAELGKLKPSILRDGQDAVAAKHGEEARMPLVFHGGSGSELSDIREAVSYGVVKMNIDTDTQYAFTRPIVTHICEHINGVLKIDYDPRSYLAKGEKGVAARLQEAADNLMSAGKTLFGKI